jgi:uncharacterized membrane protein
MSEHSMWRLQPILDSYRLVGLLAVLLVLSLWIRPTFGTLRRNQRLTLTLLRMATILVVLLAMLRPTRVDRTEKTQPATLILAVDVTPSMTVPDMQGQTRWEVLQETLSSVRPELEELSDKLEVRAYSFKSSASLVSVEAGQVQLPSSPEGKQSDIGSSLYDILRMESGKRLAGVIVLSDGAQRVVTPRVDVLQPARELARMQFPLYTVAFGQPRDPSQARDAAVQDVSDHYTVFVKNELPLRGAVWLQGLTNREIPVTMQVTKPDGTTETHGPVIVRSEKPAEAVPFDLKYVPDKPGEYRLTIEVPVQAGELVADNNQLTTYLTVLDGGVRVLYLEGNVSSQESKFVKRSLGESPEIELDYQFIPPPELATWPVPLSQLDAKPPYDVFLVGDVDASALGTAQLERLAKLISEGRGLMMLGGLYSFGPGGYFDTALNEVLPVEMNARQRQQWGEQVRKDQHLEGDLTAIPKFPHFVTQLAPASANQQTWREMKPLKGANRFEKLKDRALVLLETTAGQPLLVASQYGNGRVMAMAVDSTYRWYRFDQADQHKRFWRQVVLWLAQKEGLSQSTLAIRMDRRRYTAGSRGEFSVSARDDAGNPIDDATFDIQMSTPDGKTIPLTVNRESSDWRGMTPVLESGGQYTVNVTAKRQGTVLKTAKTEFLVRVEDIELSDPAASPEQLEQLASITKEFGGRTMVPEQLEDLLKELIEKPNEVIIELETKHQLGDTLFDALALFGALVGLLTVEWYLRKRWRLV